MNTKHYNIIKLLKMHGTVLLTYFELTYKQKFSKHSIGTDNLYYLIYE